MIQEAHLIQVVHPLLSLQEYLGGQGGHEDPHLPLVPSVRQRQLDLLHQLDPTIKYIASSIELCKNCEIVEHTISPGGPLGPCRPV